MVSPQMKKTSVPLIKVTRILALANRSSVNPRNYGSVRFQLGLLILFVFYSLLALSRNNGMDPHAGDIGIWLDIQEWISRSNTLYLDVWDHKDWGFYQFQRLFYSFGGTVGVYLSGLLATYSLSIGLYLLTREVADRRMSAVLALAGGMTYVLSPSYYVTYTENCSIAFVVLAVGLLRRRPLVGGALFALAAAIKISTLPIWICVTGVLAFYWLSSKNCEQRRKSFQTIRIGIVGFSLAFGMAILFSAIDGSLRGWIDVISYNRQYSLIRRKAYESIGSSFILPDGETTLFLTFLLTSILVAMVFVVANLVTQPPVDDNEYPRDRGLETLALVASVLIGSLFALILQAPLGPQHTQFLVGPLIALVCLLTGLSSRQILLNRRRFLKAFIVVLPIAAILFSTPATLTAKEIRNGLSNWTELNKPGPLSKTLELLPPRSTIVFFGGNSPRPDIRFLPESTRPICRFIFQFAHLFPEYQTEIESCLESKPDFMIIEAEINWEAGGFGAKVEEKIKTSYFQCIVDTKIWGLWASEISKCPPPGS